MSSVLFPQDRSHNVHYAEPCPPLKVAPHHTPTLAGCRQRWAALLADLDQVGRHGDRLLVGFLGGEVWHLGRRLRVAAEAILSEASADGWCTATRSDLARYLDVTVRHVGRIVQALRRYEILGDFDPVSRRYRVPEWVAILKIRPTRLRRGCAPWSSWALSLRATMLNYWRAADLARHRAKVSAMFPGRAPPDAPPD